MALMARNYEDLVGAAKDIETSGGRALPIKCGVTEKQEILWAAESTVDEFGTVDIRVNDAQGSSRMYQWKSGQMRILSSAGKLLLYLLGILCEHGSLDMKENGGGRIINTGSGA